MFGSEHEVNGGTSLHILLVRERARLRDPSWRVRRDAAVALRTLGGPGRMMLERALRDEDGFARDMARQTLDLPEVALPS